MSGVHPHSEAPCVGWMSDGLVSLLVISGLRPGLGPRSEVERQTVWGVCSLPLTQPQLLTNYFTWSDLLSSIFSASMSPHLRVGLR